MYIQWSSLQFFDNSLLAISICTATFHSVPFLSQPSTVQPADLNPGALTELIVHFALFLLPLAKAGAAAYYNFKEQFLHINSIIFYIQSLHIFLNAKHLLDNTFIQCVELTAIFSIRCRQSQSLANYCLQLPMAAAQLCHFPFLFPPNLNVDAFGTAEGNLKYFWHKILLDFESQCH